jgi:hypothetical protein
MSPDTEAEGQLPLRSMAGFLMVAPRGDGIMLFLASLSGEEKQTEKVCLSPLLYIPSSIRYLGFCLTRLIFLILYKILLEMKF